MANGPQLRPLARGGEGSMYQIYVWRPYRRLKTGVDLTGILTG